MEKLETIKIHLGDYNISVNQYLTYAQIQSIVNQARQFESWADRQQCIDMLVLAFATDISKEELDAHNHDYWLTIGLIPNVEQHIENYIQIEDALKYEESPVRILLQLAKEIPEFNKKVDAVMKSATSKK